MEWEGRKRNLFLLPSLTGAELPVFSLSFPLVCFFLPGWDVAVRALSLKLWIGPVPTPLLLLTHGMTVNKSHLGLSLLNCKMGLDTPATLDLTEGDFGEEV